MSRKKKDKSAQSTRQLMGIDSVKDYCIATRMGDLVASLRPYTLIPFTKTA